MANVGSGDAGKTLIGNGNGQGPKYASIGTNSGLTSHGVVVSEGLGAFEATGAGTLGQVLTSGGPSTNPSFQSISAAGAVITITGNSGSAAPSAGNINLITANSTVKFTGSSSTVTEDFGLTNLMLGSSGSSITSAVRNVGVGLSALNALTSGVDNVAVGYNAGLLFASASNNTAIGSLALSTATSNNNTAVGYKALQICTTGSSNAVVGLNSALVFTTGTNNSALGANSLLAFTGGNNNLALGANAGDHLLTGSGNILVGQAAGDLYVGAETNNIIIGNRGVAAESNVIRIGKPLAGAGQHTSAFVGGITGVTVSASSPIAIDTTGQISDLGFGTSTQVLTSNGAGVSPSWQSVSAGGAITTVTGSSGGAQSPSAGNFNILGTGSITTVGTANTETVQLTGLTNHNVLVGAGTATITKVAPSATSGIPLVSNGASADPSFTTAVVAGGGTGQVTLTNHGVLIGQGTSAIAATAAGTAGQVLQSGGASADPVYSTATYPATATSSGQILRANGVNWVATTATYPATASVGQVLAGTSSNVFSGITAGTTGQVLIGATGAAPAFGTVPAITTLTGDSGSATGNSVQVRANSAALGCGSSVLFTGSGATLTLTVTDSNNSTFIGAGAGKAGASGANNAAIGNLALPSVTSGDSNMAFGSSALAACNSGNYNVAVGVIALQSLTTTSQNVAIGRQALQQIVTGANNIAIGYQAGVNLTTNDSNNIHIGNAGTAADNAKISIGTNGTQTTCFIQGISGVTITGTAVLCSTAGQLGTVVSSLRYKENVTPIKDDVSVLALNPVEFNYKQDKSKTKQYGLIAEEVAEDFPYLCFYNEKGEPQSVKYHELPTLLLLEVKRLTKRVEELEKIRS